MSRGFLCIYYRSRGWQAEIYNRDPDRVWQACLHIMLETFRFNNPDMPMLLLDIDDQIDGETSSLLARYTTLVPSAEFDEIPFGGETNNKLLALRWSPFSETALIDLDFVVTGSLEDLFDWVSEGLGVLHYPRYRRTANRINSGVIVLKDKAILDRLEEQRDISGSDLHDETIIDLAISAKRIRASLIPDRYGKSKQMWWARTPAELSASCASDWVGALSIDWEAERPVFRLGKEIVRAFHFSSAKARMTTDATVARYQALIHSRLALLEGG